MKKSFRVTIYAGLMIAAMLCRASGVLAQYSRIYDEFLDQARTAIHQKDYRKALLYLKTAQQASPNHAQELVPYFNLVQRALSGEGIQEISSPREVSQDSTVPSSSLTKTTSDEHSGLSHPQTPSDSVVSINESHETVMTASASATTDTADSVRSVPTDSDALLDKTEEVEHEPLVSSLMRTTEQDDRITHILTLDDVAWSLQPDTRIEIYLDQALIIKGTDIERFLVVLPGFFRAERINRREVRLIPQRYGQSFFHVWDSGRRWTFYVHILFTAKAEKGRAAAEPQWQKSVEAWRMRYDLRWSSFHQGDSHDNLERQSLRVRHSLKIAGPTPYGNFDAYTSAIETDQQDLDVTDYSMALTEARWRNWKDISIRLFDANKAVSPLTFPGQDFRGILLQGQTVDDQWEMIYLRGQDQASFGLLSSDIVDSRDSYYEAGKLTYNFSPKQSASLNYARSWGDDRSETVSSQVVSGEYQYGWNAWTVASEVAWDEDQSAQQAWAKYDQDDRVVSIKVRNVPGDYATVIGTTGTQGEIGTEFTVRQEWEDGSQWNTYLDLYRDRESKNPDDPNALNMDFNTSFRRRLPNKDFFQGQLFYTKTPGLISDREDLRLSGNYGHRFEAFSISNALWSWGSVYQRTRSESSPAADYDRISVSTNLTLPITAHLQTSLAYEVSCVDDVAINETAWPRVFTASMSYRKTISKHWRMNSRLYYRDEERTEDSKSFLSGQDSLNLGVNLTYASFKGFNAYLDGRFRDVWAENNNDDAFMEADIRLGVTLDWDLGLRWNPVGFIEGYVFKDINRDGVRDAGEPGIPGVRVKAGLTSAVTDDQGWYSARVRAASAIVRVDEDTLPEGYVFQDISSWSFDITHQQHYHGDFALTTDSGVYGVVFYDENGNGRPDNGDTFISGVRIVLDDDQSVRTDSRGAYFFYNLAQGAHIISIDISSVPRQYLPTIPVRNRIVVSEGSSYIFHIPVKDIPSK